MREIPISRGLVTLVDDEDYEALARYKWHAQPRHHNIYVYRTLSRAEAGTRMVKMHRVILKAPDGVDVDHRDGDGLNNQKSNLRLATNAQNQANRHRLVTNTSGRRGVHWVPNAWSPGCWRAVIYQNNKQIHPGRFADLDEAARAYDRAALELFGEFARLNFPEVASNG